jgi:hypothetical protein
MTKVKVNEATGRVLDHLVAVAEGVLHTSGYWDTIESCYYNDPPHYRIDWAHSGPIIEREGITVSKTAHGFWEAYKRPASAQECYQVNDTPLIAAMRCYVASKLGDEVEIPKELL